MSDFFLEREIINKAIRAEWIAKEIIYIMSDKIREKANRLNSKIPEELFNKLCDRDEPIEKEFTCQKCGKVFNDGRKLGGHISRAHPAEKTMKLASQRNLSKSKGKIEIVSPSRVLGTQSMEIYEEE